MGSPFDGRYAWVHVLLFTLATIIVWFLFPFFMAFDSFFSGILFVGVIFGVYVILYLSRLPAWFIILWHLIDGTYREGEYNKMYSKALKENRDLKDELDKKSKIEIIDQYKSLFDAGELMNYWSKKEIIKSIIIHESK